MGLAEIDEEKSLKAYVAEALRQVGWMKQATGFVSWRVVRGVNG